MANGGEEAQGTRCDSFHVIIGHIVTWFGCNAKSSGRVFEALGPRAEVTAYMLASLSNVTLSSTWSLRTLSWIHWVGLIRACHGLVMVTCCRTAELLLYCHLWFHKKVHLHFIRILNLNISKSRPFSMGNRPAFLRINHDVNLHTWVKWSEGRRHPLRHSSAWWEHRPLCLG